MRVASASARLASMVVVAGAVGLAACAGVLGLGASEPGPFPHRAHVRSGISCTDCHRGMSEGTRTDALHLPGDDTCAETGCHPGPHREPSDLGGRPCLACHGRPDTRVALVQARAHLRFEHRAHEAAGAGKCVRCHSGVRRDDDRLRPAMAECLGCHHHRDQFEIRDCDGCHVDLAAELSRPASHLVHTDDFARTHGDVAAASADLCGSCHRQTFCTSCHGAEVPLLPSRSEPEDPLRAGVHRAGFLARHAVDAHAEPALCTSCHSPSSCRDCHERAGVASAGAPGAGAGPHPPGWVGVTRNDHGPAARRDPVSCAGCHGGAGELLCVDCHREGGVGGNPHPPGWRSNKPLSQRPCRLCHVVGLP
ncbi:hypothetical protein [Haliangium sp.]|uniref:hypothetical protein n=1 Tax=Haliangium sp. TaxID=2663208 RepID=UPI003D1308D1